jgi:transposase
MSQNFIAVDREQAFLLPPDVRDWLPEGHLAWFVLDAVGQMDLSAFYAAYRRDGWGRPAYDPAMMVALLLYSYARAERSSRGIERRCGEDVAYRVITANEVPDHSTLARFRRDHEDALAGLFTEVLALCAKAGLVNVGVIAVDGTKLHANASDRSNLTYEQIARELLEQAEETDRAEDERFGKQRGDELPPELRVSGDRRKRLATARRLLDDEREAEGEQVPRDRTERLRQGERRLREEWELDQRVNAEYERWRAQGISADGRKFGGRDPDPYKHPESPQGIANSTDPGSRKVKTPRGYMQGYNAQAVTTSEHIVVAAEVTVTSSDSTHLAPMITAACEELHAAGITTPPEVVVADAGYWNRPHIEHLVNQGIQTLVCPEALNRATPRPGRDGGLYAFMRRVLESEAGHALYKQRQAMIEPVFAHIKHNRRADRFQRRGRAACRSEWRLITATHNLLKLHRHQTAPVAA